MRVRPVDRILPPLGVLPFVTLDDESIYVVKAPDSLFGGDNFCTLYNSGIYKSDDELKFKNFIGPVVYQWRQTRGPVSWMG